MTMGALIDAGADPVAVAAILDGLGLDGYALTFEPVLRCGVAATHAVVVVDGEAHHDAGDGHNHDPADDHHPGHDHDDDHVGHRHHADHRPYRAIRELLLAA